MEAPNSSPSRPTPTSVSSVRTNSRLPVACSDDVHNSASVDRPQNYRDCSVNTTSTTSSWQDGFGHRNEIALAESTCCIGAAISLRSDAADVCRSRGSLAPELPCYASCNNVGGDSSDRLQISLHSDLSVTAATNDRHHHNMNLISRLSRDGGGMSTDIDANVDCSCSVSQRGCSTATSVWCNIT